MEQIFITMAPYSWGKANTAEESIKNCRKQLGKAMKDYDVYRAHPETTIDGIGAFSYPQGDEVGQHAPVLIKRVRKGKAVQSE